MKEKILDLRGEGKTYSQIADTLKCAKSTVSYYCNEDGKNAVRRRRKRNARANMTKIKLQFGGKCSRCNYNRCLDALDFHHVDPTTKKGSVMYLLRNFAYQTAVEEANKCILICSNCHREIHSKLAV